MKASDELEPCAVRVASTVLRGRGDGDAALLPDQWAWRPGIKLEELAEVLRLGMTKTEGMDGSRVYDRFREGRREEIADYCLRDVELTREIYYRLTFEKPAAPTAN